MRFDSAERICRDLEAVFREYGEDLYLVGGYVRDAILGRPTKDVDLATSAHPPDVKRYIAQTSPTAVYAVGEKFGTVGAIYARADEEVRVEITTFRSEKYTPRSRLPEVSFGTGLEGDLARRDFTINALARTISDGRLIDRFGGVDDLRRRVIRAVGNPDERFAEDPLRLLRAVRFAAELGFDVEPATRAGIARNAAGLSDISRERVIEELNRVLLSPAPAAGLALLVDLGLAAHVLPELLALRTTSQGHRTKDVLAHTLKVVERSPRDLVSRWSALLHDIAKPRTVAVEAGVVTFHGHDALGERMTRDILSRLRMDLHSAERVASLVGLHMRANEYDDDWTDGAVRRLMRDAGEDLPLLLALSLADVTSQRQPKVQAAAEKVRRLAARANAIAEAENIQAIKSPLDGNDLMVIAGRGPGKWIAPIKDRLLAMVLDGTLKQEDREAAEAIARSMLAEAGEVAR